jgi:hypothetical protein
MVDSTLINDNILTPLMLRSRANTFEGVQNNVDYEKIPIKLLLEK